VRVLEVKLDKNQIALTMKSERVQEQPRPRRDDRRERPPQDDGRSGKPTRSPRAPATKPEPPAKTTFNSGFAVLEKLRRR
jgi:transcriptional accessory protein Tex/SPT6